jgi:hypothetical protein
VRLGPSTPGDYVRVRVLVPPKPRCDNCLGVMLFTNSVTESVQFLYRCQKLNCLLKLILQSVHDRYNKVVDVFLILFVLKFHNHRPDSLRVMNFTN